MLIVLFGFVLFGVFLLGLALVALSLLLLGVALGLQAFVAVFAITGGPAPGVATAVLLAAGAGFVLGLIVVAIGSSSLLFAPVRALLRGIWLVARMASHGFPFISALVGLLRGSALALETGASVLQGAASASLTNVGDFLIDAGNALPPIPRIEFQTESLWLKFDSHGNRTEGFLPKPPLIPDVEIVTSMSKTTADASPIETALVNSGGSVKTVGDKIEDAGDSFADTAQAMNDMADLLEDVS